MICYSRYESEGGKREGRIFLVKTTDTSTHSTQPIEM